MGKRILIAGLVVVALLGAGIALFVSAPSGQRFLTDRILRAIGGADQTVTVKEIGGEWPSHIIWTGVSVADRDGIWLTLDRLDVRLRPAALLLGRMDIDNAVVGAAHMLRRPVKAQDTQPPPPPTVESTARALRGITVRDMRVDVIQLDPPVMGRAVDATLAGSLAEDTDSGLHTLALDGRLRTEPGSLAL
jgi:translocation and assembly module TamB